MASLEPTPRTNGAFSNRSPRTLAVTLFGVSLFAFAIMSVARAEPPARVTGIVTTVDVDGNMTISSETQTTTARVWANTVEPGALSLVVLGRFLDCHVAYAADDYVSVSICGFGAGMSAEHTGQAQDCDLTRELFCLAFPRLDIALSDLEVGKRRCSETDWAYLEMNRYVHSEEINYRELCASFEESF